MVEALRKLVHCECLGERILGEDVDTIFAYPTPKVVYIKDRTLGVVKYLLMLAIFCYIVVYQLGYSGEQFEMSAVEGISRQQWQHPTKHGCNPSKIDCASDFTPVSELPYCKQYAGSSPSPTRASCMYFDAFELPIVMLEGVLMPTSIETYEQRRDCTPGTAHQCEYRYVNTKGQLERGTGKAEPLSVAYVADVEKFTLLVDHSFRSANGKMVNNGRYMQGSYRVCSRDGAECTTKLIPTVRCVNKDCPTELGSSTDLVVYSIKYGDVFSLGTLVTMAGRTLEDTIPKGKPLRRRGGALVVNIEYHNLRRWSLWSTKDPPDYTISATFMNVTKFKQTYVHHESDKVRMLKVKYGIYVMVQQSGQIAFFDLSYTLMVLTTALGLFVASSTLTDMLAIYILPRKAQYYQCKYEETEDFSETADRREKGQPG